MSNTIVKIIEVVNNGNSTATGVVVDYSAPNGTYIVSTQPDRGTYDADTEKWAIGTIYAGETVKMKVTLFVTDPNAAQILSEASVSGNETETTLLNNTDNDIQGLSNIVMYADDDCCGDCGEPGVKAFDIENACLCGSLIVNECSFCQDGSVTYFKIKAGSGVNLNESNISLNSATGAYSVNTALMDLGQDWEFKYDVFCRKDGITLGPLATGTVTGTGLPPGVECSSPNVTFEAGDTATVGDDANGTAIINTCNGEVVHLWSSDGLVQVNISEGSAVIDLTASEHVKLNEWGFTETVTVAEGEKFFVVPPSLDGKTLIDVTYAGGVFSTSDVTVETYLNDSTIADTPTTLNDAGPTATATITGGQVLATGDVLRLNVTAVNGTTTGLTATLFIQ